MANSFSSSGSSARDGMRGFIRVASFLAMALGIGMALASMGNSMPKVWVLPNIGPFQAEPLRASIFVAAVAVVLLTNGFTRLAVERRRFPLALGALADAVILCASAYAAYDFVVTQLKVNEGLFFFQPHHAVIAMAGAIVFIVLCWRIWGLPLTAFGALLLLYYFFGQYMPSIFRVIPMSFIDNFAEDVWYNLNKGILGSIFGITIFTVFPFVIFGAILEASGVGGSLIRFAFLVTRRTRGGPAHAAVLASSMFGTMSGVPVANVVGTGVLTIPMIKRRGFTPAFAGAIEATASTGGQIVPPVMGAAALVMADYLQVSYLTIMVAALLPALLFYVSLFFTVTFESRRLGIMVGAGDDPSNEFGRDDIVNLAVLAGAIAVIIVTLSVGMSASAAGVFVILYLMPASFLTKDVRRRPMVLLEGFARGGIQFSELVMAVGVVGIILSVLTSTGLPIRIGTSIDSLMGHSLFLALAVTAAAAIVFGMGLPTLPAYLTIILLLGPALTKLGLGLLVAHMFVMFFGCSSSITPPVAIAAYAGASIAGAGPLRTAFLAMRIGAAIMIVPFVFAYYPEILLVKEAGGFELDSVIFVLTRVVVAFWLMTSAFAFHDRTRLKWPEVAFRLALAVATLVVDPYIHWPAFVAGLSAIAYNNLVAYRRPVPAA